jgi:hypothetical protein
VPPPRLPGCKRSRLSFPAVSPRGTISLSRVNGVAAGLCTSRTFRCSGETGGRPLMAMGETLPGCASPWRRRGLTGLFVAAGAAACRANVAPEERRGARTRTRNLRRDTPPQKQHRDAGSGAAARGAAGGRAVIAHLHGTGRYRERLSHSGMNDVSRRVSRQALPPRTRACGSLSRDG